MYTGLSRVCTGLAEQCPYQGRECHSRVVSPGLQDHISVMAVSMPA